MSGEMKVEKIGGDDESETTLPVARKSERESEQVGKRDTLHAHNGINDANTSPGSPASSC